MIGRFESIVCNIDLALQLKDLGLPQRTIFYWNEYYGPCNYYEKKVREIPNDPTAPAAYTADELINLLPGDCKIYYRLNGNYVIATDKEYVTNARTIADALATVIIEMSKQKQIALASTYPGEAAGKEEKNGN